MTIATNGRTPDLDDLIDLQKSVFIYNADVGSAAFVTNSKVAGILLKLKDSDG